MVDKNFHSYKNLLDYKSWKWAKLVVSSDLTISDMAKFAFLSEQRLLYDYILSVILNISDEIPDWFDPKSSKSTWNPIYKKFYTGCSIF